MAIHWGLIPRSPMSAYVTSWALSPLVFSIYNALVAVYIAASIIVRFALRDGGAEQSFTYFTDLTFWGIGFYHLFTAYHGFTYSREKGCPLDWWGELMQGLHAVFYTTVITFPWLVTAVYWVILWDTPATAKTYGMWSNITTHALNSFFALMQIILPNTDPSPISHLLFLIFLLALYLALAYVTKATQGYYTYSFLNPDKGAMVAAYVFGIMAAIIIIYLIAARGAIWIRRKATAKRVEKQRDVPVSMEQPKENA